MPVVEVPGHGDVEFPDDMSDDQIAAAIKKNLEPAKSRPPSLGSFSDPYAYFKPEVQRAVGNTGAGLQPVVGAGEAALQVGTGAAGALAGGFSGIGQGIKNRFSQGMPAADRVRQVQGALTYRPRTESGQNSAQSVSDAFDPNVGTSKLNVLTWPGRVGRAAGDVSSALNAPAWLSTALEVAPDAATPWLAGKGMKALSTSRAAQVAKPLPKPIPTTAELRTATNAAYKRGEESGVMVKADEYAKAADEIIANAKSEAMDPVLHPKSSRIAKVLEERKGKDLDLQEAENLRRIALEAEGDVNSVGAQTGDGRIAGKIVDDLDDKVDALSVNAEARALNRRKANSQLIDMLTERAEVKAGANYTQSGLENALRKEFQALALNNRRMKRFSLEQKEAIKRVAKGGKLENTLRNIGKFDPTTGGMAAALSAGLGGGFAVPTGGASLMLPLLGYAGKRGATSLALRNVEKAREALVGRGLPDLGAMPARGAGAVAPAGQAQAGVGAGGNVPPVLGVPDEALINALLAARRR